MCSSVSHRVEYLQNLQLFHGGLSLGRHKLHAEVSYIPATSVVSQEDWHVLGLRGADVPVGELGRLKFHLALDFYLVEDKSLFHLLPWVMVGVYALQQNRNKTFCEMRAKDTVVEMTSCLVGMRMAGCKTRRQAPELSLRSPTSHVALVRIFHFLNLRIKFWEISCG